MFKMLKLIVQLISFKIINCYQHYWKYQRIAMKYYVNLNHLLVGGEYLLSLNNLKFSSYVYRGLKLHIPQEWCPKDPIISNF
jgi:hypothetical protein